MTAEIAPVDHTDQRDQLQTATTETIRDRQSAATDRPRCANPSCRRGWLGFLKDRRRPIFEDRWACSGHCLRTLLDAAIRRESPVADGRTSEHQHRVPLGLILLSRGWITQPQLQHALAMQRQAGGGRIGRWLIEECGVPEERILHGLALQWRSTVLSLHDFNPRQMALLVPREIIQGASVLPLRISARGPLRLAFTDCPDHVAALAMQRMSGLNVESGLLPQADWRLAHEELLRSQTVPCAVEKLSGPAGLSRRLASDLVGMAPRASRLVRIHRFFWLRMWLEDAAPHPADRGAAPSREDTLDRIYIVDAGLSA